MPTIILWTKVDDSAISNICIGFILGNYNNYKSFQPATIHLTGLKAERYPQQGLPLPANGITARNMARQNGYYKDI